MTAIFKKTRRRSYLKTQALTNAKSNKSFPRKTPLPGFLTYPRLVLTIAALLGVIGIGWMVVEFTLQRSQVDQAQAGRIALEQREKELQELLERQQRASSDTEAELERMREEKDLLGHQPASERQIAKSQTPPLPANLNIVSYKLAAPMRTVGQVTTIPIPTGADYVLLQVELEPDDFPSYNAVLLTQPGRGPAGWRRERLESKALGVSKVLEIRISARLLKSQEYLLAVSGNSNRGIAEEER